MAKVRFTAGRVAAFECPAGSKQAFMWDSEAPGLGLRVVRKSDGSPGSRAYVFQGEFLGATLRMTLGSASAWTIGQAQDEARRLQVLIDAGRDPREAKAEAIAADVAKREARRRASATVAEAWTAYLAERKPHWSERHYADHEKLAQSGGAKRKRGAGLTVAGPLAELMPLRLDELDADRLKTWAARESTQRPARVRLALRLLTVFLGWCATRPAFAVAAHPKAASGRDVREVVGKPARKDDALQREQLPAWFDAVRRLDNPVIAAYLQALLLTGARREELAGLRWENVDFRWRSLAMRDKVEGGRMVPLTTFVAHLLAALPRRTMRDGKPNPWVFSSGTSESGRLVEPRIAHDRACAVAGLDGLTLHGLRRSFGTLSEWVEAPVGVVAQIQGHKPSAIAEKHYRVRPLDLLRMWHEKIEAWMLEQAGVSFDAKATAQGALRIVAS